MNSPPILPRRFDLLDSQGRISWATIWLLSLLMIYLGAFWPIYPVQDNSEIESLLQPKIVDAADQHLSQLQSKEEKQRLSFDVQALLYIHQLRGTRAIAVQHFSSQEWGRTLMLISKYTTDLAKGEVVLGLMLLAALYSRIKGLSGEIAVRANTGLVGMLLAATLTWVSKIGAGRARPNGLFYRGDLDWIPFSLENLHHSFPSGHATAAGALMMVFIFNFPRYRFLWLGAALWICATRVLTLNHWPTDTWMGLLIGAFSVALISSITQLRREVPAQEPARYQSSRETTLPVE